MKSSVIAVTFALLASLSAAGYSQTVNFQMVATSSASGGMSSTNSQDWVDIADLRKNTIVQCTTSDDPAHNIPQPLRCYKRSYRSGHDDRTDWHNAQWINMARHSGPNDGGSRHWFHLNPQTGEIVSCYDTFNDIVCASATADIQ